MYTRNRTSTKIIGYGLYLYFLGLSFRNTAKALSLFLSNVLDKYIKHQVSSDVGGTWYPQACKSLKLNHHLHSHYKKSLIERTMQYIKDRTECIDNDYFPCKKNKCELNHIKQWLDLFVYQHKKEFRTITGQPYIILLINFNIHNLI